MKRNLVIILAMSALAATPAKQPIGPTDPLPPAAQAQLDKGVAAAKAADYPRALEAFQRAWSAAPESALVFLNLGLAESKMPARELRAIAWFGAYLAAYPDASNAAAVRQEIAALRTRNAANLVGFAQSVVEAARSQGKSGDIEAAERDLGQALVKAGDFAGAQKILDAMEDPENKTPVLQTIADGKLDAGDVEGAKAALTAAQQAAIGRTNYAEALKDLCDIAVAQAKAGDPVGARQSIALAVQIPGRFSTEKGRSKALCTVARGRFAIGDPDGARDILTAARTAADAIVDADQRRIAITAVGVAQAETGDVTGAIDTAESLTENYAKGVVMTAAAKAQAATGHVIDARRTAGEMPEFMRSRAFVAIADAQIAARNPTGARESLATAGPLADRLKNPLERTLTQVAIARDQIEAGDRAGARTTLEAAEKSQKKISVNKEAGLHGVGADPQFGQTAVSDAFREIAWAETPSAKWTFHLTGALNADPFIDLATHVKNLKPSQPDPKKYLQALLDTTDRLEKERDLIEQMLAGGNPD